MVKEIKRRTRRVFSAEEKIKIVLEGLRGDDSIAAICRKHDIHQNSYFKWSKDFIHKNSLVSKELKETSIRSGIFKKSTDFKDEFKINRIINDCDHLAGIFQKTINTSKRKRKT